MKIIASLFLTVLSLMAIEPVVSPEWLNKHIDDKNLRVVEVSQSESYKLSHIKNAAHTTIGAWRFNNGTFLSIRPVKEIEKEIRALGIEQDTNVVLYAPINTPKDLLKATYIYWALNYHGVKNVALLDGGMKAYKDAKFKLCNKKTDIKATNFKAKLDEAKIADINYVKDHLGKLPMIDARPSDKYLGINPTPTVRRNGHIKGGMSYSWNYSINEDYTLKPKQLLDSVFQDGYKLKKNEEVLVYCTGGLETSFNYFVLSGVLGYKNVRLYDASMKEWGNLDDTPMVQYTYEVYEKQ